MSEASVFVISAVILVTLGGFARAADPDPVFDFASSTAENSYDSYHRYNPQQEQSPPDSSKFVIRDVFRNGDVSNGPGGVRAGLFPVMDSQGLTYVHFNMTPCGVNLPHMHPRAMVAGGPLQVGFVDTEGNSHINVLNPGTLTGGGALLNLPARATAAALNQDLASVSKIKDTIYKHGPQLQMTPPNTCVPGKDITTTFK